MPVRTLHHLAHLWHPKYRQFLCRTDRPSRISTVFYMGLEGLGGLEMETDEDENVSSSRDMFPFVLPASKGLDGPVVFTGNSVDLDEFTIRVVDGD